MTDAPKLLSREELTQALAQALSGIDRVDEISGSMSAAYRLIRAHIAALEAERDVLKAAGALKVNADVIAMILSEAGVRDASYLAVKIANELDPPNLPSYDPMQVARFYLLLGKPDAPTATLSHEAARRVAEFSAAYARGLEDAAKVAEKSREHWRSASPQTEPWTPEQMTMRLTEADYLAAAIRALKPGEAE